MWEGKPQAGRSWGRTFQESAWDLSVHGGPWVLHWAYFGACSHTLPGSSSREVQAARPPRPCHGSTRAPGEGAEVGEEAGCC